MQDNRENLIPNQIAAALEPYGLVPRGGFVFDEENAPSPLILRGAFSKCCLVWPLRVGHLAAFHAVVARSRGFPGSARSMVQGCSECRCNEIRCNSRVSLRSALSAVSTMGDARRGTAPFSTRNTDPSTIRALAGLSRGAAIRSRARFC